jgi:hypothetical protein
MQTLAEALVSFRRGVLAKKCRKHARKSKMWSNLSNERQKQRFSVWSYPRTLWHHVLVELQVLYAPYMPTIAAVAEDDTVFWPAWLDAAARRYIREVIDALPPPEPAKMPGLPPPHTCENAVHCELLVIIVGIDGVRRKIERESGLC